MNPLLAIGIEALHGLALGLASPVLPQRPRRREEPTAFGVIVAAPLLEEAIFRALPLELFPSLPPGITAVPFGLAHLDAEMTPAWNLFRAADTGASGAVIELAYRGAGLGPLGYVSAATAHAAHNLMGLFGTVLAAVARAPAPTLRRRPRRRRA